MKGKIFSYNLQLKLGWEISEKTAAPSMSGKNKLVSVKTGLTYHLLNHNQIKSIYLGPAWGRSLIMYWRVEAPKRKRESICNWVGLCFSNPTFPMYVPCAGKRKFVKRLKPRTKLCDLTRKKRAFLRTPEMEAIIYLICEYF